MITVDSTLPWFISQKIPVGIKGFIISAIFAASMSSVDSSMNSIATTFVNDFYRRFKKGVSDYACLNIARGLTVFLGVFAIILASGMARYQDQIGYISELAFKLISLMMSSLTGVFLLGIFSKRSHGAGTFIGAISGSILMWLAETYTDISFFLYTAIGTVSCMVIGYFASLILPSKGKSVKGLTYQTLIRNKV